MAGLLVGNIACGQIADLVGRKRPYFLALLILAVFNLISAFSVSWAMFAAVRFILGVAVGFVFTIQYNLAAEFTQVRNISTVVRHVGNRSQ